MTYAPKHKKPDAIDDWSNYFKNISEKNKVRYKDFEKSYCQGFEDGMDGFVIHAPACPNYQDTAISGSRCIGYTSHCRWPVGLSEVR